MTRSSGSKKKIQLKPTAAQGKKKSPPVHDLTQSFIYKWGPFLLLAISSVIVLQARLKLLAIPLERDEGGFAYIGHWLLQGKSLYTDMVDNKLPGLYLLYLGFTNLFGYSAVGVHTGLLLTSAVSAVCFYFLARDLFNPFVAAIATSFFLLLTAAPNVVGFAAHATQLLLPFVIGGFLILWRAILSGRLVLFFIAGILLGFAFIIKQQSVVFGMMAALIWWPVRIWWNRHDKKWLPILEWILLGVGGLLPVSLTIGYFAITGRFDDLYFWTFEQPSQLAASFAQPRWELFRNIFPLVVESYFLIWIFAGAGLLTIWFSRVRKNTIAFGIFFSLLGLGSVVIGAAFYNHYFILAMPGIALLSAISLYWISLKVKKAGLFISLSLGMLLMLWPLVAQSDYFFKPDYIQIHQKAYNENMFPELEIIGKELSKRVSINGKIGIFGSEPGVLVAADRSGCSKHLFMYPLLSDPKTSPAFQQEFRHEMQECLPEYIVWNTSTGSWAIGYDQLQIFQQLMEWVGENYTTSAIAELRPGLPGIIVWDEAVASYQSQSNYKVYVFKRKN